MKNYLLEALQSGAQKFHGFLRTLYRFKVPFIFAISFIFFVIGFSLHLLPWFLLLLVASVLCYLSPKWGLVLVSVVIPLKGALHTIAPQTALTLLIPCILLFSYLGFWGQSLSEPEITEADLLIFLIFFASIFSTLGFAIIYGFRSTIVLDFFVWLQLVGFYLLGKNLLRTVDLKRFGLLNLVIANIVSLWALIVYFASRSTGVWIETYELIRNRSAGPLGNPNALAGYLLLLIVFVLATGLLKKNKWAAVLLALPFAAFFLTFSRGAWAVAILLVLVYLIKEKKYLWVGGAVLLLVLGFFVAPISIQKRIENIGNPEHLSFSADSGRIWAFKNVFFINRNHLAFGNGWGSYGGEYAYSKASPTYLEGVQGGVVGVGNTDDQWLQVYAQQGVIGVWLYLLLFGFTIFKNFRKNLLTFVLIGFVVLAAFSDVFQFYQIAFWGFMVLGYLSLGKQGLSKRANG